MANEFNKRIEAFANEYSQMLKGHLEYLEHELEEEMKRDPESEHVLDIQSRIEKYKKDAALVSSSVLHQAR